MNLIIKIFKTFTAGFLAFSFLMAITLSACTPKSSGTEDSDRTEEAAGEHPTDSSEHPTADSTATADEHPKAAEHPTDAK